MSGRLLDRIATIPLTIGLALLVWTAEYFIWSAETLRRIIPSRTNERMRRVLRSILLWRSFDSSSTRSPCSASSCSSATSQREEPTAADRA